jgi:hypothetical protein
MAFVAKPMRTPVSRANTNQNYSMMMPVVRSASAKNVMKPRRQGSPACRLLKVRPHAGPDASEGLDQKSRRKWLVVSRMDPEEKVT